MYSIYGAIYNIDNNSHISGRYLLDFLLLSSYHKTLMFSWQRLGRLNHCTYMCHTWADSWMIVNWVPAIHLFTEWLWPRFLFEKPAWEQIEYLLSNDSRPEFINHGSVDSIVHEIKQRRHNETLRSGGESETISLFDSYRFLQSIVPSVWCENTNENYTTDSDCIDTYNIASLQSRVRLSYSDTAFTGLPF